MFLDGSFWHGAQNTTGPWRTSLTGQPGVPEIALATRKWTPLLLPPGGKSSGFGEHEDPADAAQRLAKIVRGSLIYLPYRLVGCQVIATAGFTLQ